MIDWANVYQRLMSDLTAGKIIPHISILGGSIILGLFLGIYANHNLTLMFLIWFIGALVDYLVFGNQFLTIFTKNKPYLLEGTIAQRVRKLFTEEAHEYEKFYFEIDVHEAYIIHKGGLDALNYSDKEGEIRLEVPESMFLSFRAGDEVSLVCAHDDKVWGWVREDEVINIDE